MMKISETDFSKSKIGRAYKLFRIKNGYYRYRTNPNPDTVPWVITGAMGVAKLLDDYDVADILGGNAPERQGGNKTLAELGF